jgi:hypothetical protein
MDNLVFTCTDALDQPATPACATDYGERIVGIAFMKKGGTFTVASDYPTKAEFDVAIAAGEVSFYSGISNGHRVEQGATELSGDDTVTGGTERYDVNYRIEGRIKILDQNIARATEKLDRYSQLRAWFFTDKNYCFGGADGYLVSPNFSEIIFEGKGQPPYISFFVEYTAVGADYARYDADYDALTN